MPNLVVSNATLRCSFGSAPSSLTVQPHRVNASRNPMATVLDKESIVNIMPFGLCSSPSNPQVAAANNIPQPCVPVTTSPWSLGALPVRIGRIVALTSDSKCMCNWAGVVEITQPGQTRATTE